MKHLITIIAVLLIANITIAAQQTVPEEGYWATGTPNLRGPIVNNFDDLDTRATANASAITGKADKTGTDPITTTDTVTANKLTIAEIAEPSTPASGYGDIYIKSDNLLYFKNDAGTEILISGASGTPEGTAILSTGETGGTKFLGEDGDGTSSWKVIPTGTGDLLADGTVPLTANWDLGAYYITGTRFISDIATGTAPFGVSSTTVVTNLNADTVDGESASAFQDTDSNLDTLSSPTNWRLFYSNGSASLIELALGTSGTLLTSNGATAAPTFEAAGGSMVYPGAGIPLSTGSAWGTSYTLNALAIALGAEANTVSGLKTFSTFPVSPSSAPTTDYQFANKKYVDDNAGTGDVVGPASATDNAFPRYDSTTGELLQNGQTIEDDSGNVTVAGTFTATGAVSTGSSANPSYKAYDSDAGGTGEDEYVGGSFWNWIDGGVGAENSDWWVSAMQAGSEIILMLFDESDDRIEPQKPILSTEIIQGGTYTATYSSNQTLTTEQCLSGIIYFTGAGTAILPAVFDGAKVAVITNGAFAISVDPNSSDLIYLNGTALDDGDKITNTSTTGDIAILIYYSAVGWFAYAPGWTDGGA